MFIEDWARLPSPILLWTDFPSFVLMQHYSPCKKKHKCISSYIPSSLKTNVPNMFSTISSFSHFEKQKKPRADNILTTGPAMHHFILVLSVKNFMKQSCGSRLSNSALPLNVFLTASLFKYICRRLEVGDISVDMSFILQYIWGFGHLEENVM